MVRADEGGIEREGQRHCRHRLDAAGRIGEPQLAERQSEQPGSKSGDACRDRKGEQEVPRKRAPMTAPVAMNPMVTKSDGKRPCTSPVACKNALAIIAPRSVPAGTPKRFIATASPPLTAKTATDSRNVLVAIPGMASGPVAP